MPGSFIAGMIVGGAMAHRPNMPADTSSAAPTMCVVAENYVEYRDCRWPEIWGQLYSTNNQNATYCDRMKDSPRECSVAWRTGMEWRGILRQRGITPR